MEANSGGEDRISNLPDDVLSIILSKLELKPMVQTSILSSRWRYLWISVPSLDINQKVFQSRNSMISDSYGKFVKFVNMVLETKTRLQDLVICCDSDYHTDNYTHDLVVNQQLHKWIVDAVRLKVSNLDLQIHYHGNQLRRDQIRRDHIFLQQIRRRRSLTLPLCLFTCNTLTSLKLDFNGYLSLPDSVYLTALKTMHLASICFITDESTDSFFLRCPVLETLSILHCEYKDLYKNNYLPSSIVRCETLVSFKMLNFFPFTTFNNFPDSVYLPSLKCLDVGGSSPLFSGDSICDVFFSNCPSLEFVDLSCSNNSLHCASFIRYVFTCKTLVKLYVHERVPDFVDLPCLKILSLNSRCIDDDDEGIPDDFFFGCPVLETLIIFNCSSIDGFFFESQSLTKLELKMLQVNNDSSISILVESMSLPALKTLHLESFLLNAEDSINDLLTRCPVLESLTLMSCEFTRVNLNGSFHKLSHLKLVGNKSITCFGSVNFGFKINAPNLTSFICETEDYMPNDYIIESLSSTVKVDINFTAQRTYFNLPEHKKQLYVRQMMKILGVLCNVKDLALSAWFLEVVSGALNLPDSPTIPFCNLRCLKLITWRTMNCAHAVMYLLEYSPNIESLSVEFAKIPSSCPISEENPTGKAYWQEWSSMSCMLHHLTYVKLQEFTGCYFELKFVEFLLKNAMSLQKLMICFAKIWGPMNHVESRVVKLNEEVLSLPRASASVEIVLYYPGNFTNRISTPTRSSVMDTSLKLS